MHSLKHNNTGNNNMTTINKATYGIRLNSNKLIEDFSHTVTVESAVWEDNE